MASRVLSLLLIAAVLHPALFCAELALPDAPSAVHAKVKADLERYAREKKNVRVDLTTKTRLVGRVQEIGPEHFMVADEKTGQTTRVSYNEVAQVKKVGMSKGAKIAIGVGVAAGALIGIGVLVACSGPGGPHC